MSEFLPLNPSDHVLLVMDREIRAAGLPGAWCSFALELEGQPDTAELEAGLSELVKAFPVLSAHLIQRGRLYGWHTSGEPIPLIQHHCQEHSPVSDAWQQPIHELMHCAPDAFEAAPLSFHLIAGEERSLILARWLHPLMDAGGIKRLFDFLMAEPAQRQRYLHNDRSLVNRKLEAWSWRRRLTLLWRGKRHNDRIDRQASSLPALPIASGKRSLHTCQLIMNPEQTQRIMESLYRRVGLGGQSLYFIGCLMRALETMEPAVRQDGWCLPYAFNLRPGNAPVPVTGNQVSVLFSQATHERVSRRDSLFEHLKSQYAETIRRELDMAYLPLMWLGRWLSLPRYGRILRQQKSGGERSSAWFSDIGEIRFTRPDFLGAQILGIRHGCFVTAPPSLAVLFSRFDGQLTMSINYLQPELAPEWIARFRDHLTIELLMD